MSTDDALIDARSLSRRRPRFAFAGAPRGWFVVAFSDEITKGEVHRLHYFGRDLIAYRGASGQVFVHDAYCPHLGAHLGHGGTIEGDSIRCPFHGWRFDGDGRCAAIPYSDKIPAKARLVTFPVREQNGAIHVFHTPPGLEEGEPWELPELDEAGWTEGRTVHWRNLRTHPQEVFENTVDTAHIAPIHDGRSATLVGKPVIEREKMQVEITFQAPGAVVGMPDLLNDVRLFVTMRGLGWVVVQTHVENVDVRARQRIYVTPVDDETVDIRAMVHVRATDDAAFTAELAEIFHRAYVEDFAKDFPIWENKRYLGKPQLAKGDGPIGAYRHWCAQFYAPIGTSRASAPSMETREEAQRAVPNGVRASLRAKLASLGGELASSLRRVRTFTERGPSAVSEATTAKSGSEPAARAAANERASALPKVETAADYFESLEKRFVPAAAHGVDAVFQWELSGEGGRVFHAQVQGGGVRVRAGSHAQPSVALVMPAEDYVRVVNGELDGVRAFTSGRGKVRGSIPLAMKMRTLFPA